MVGTHLLTAILVLACVGCRSTPVCSQSSTVTDFPLGAKLLDSSEGALLWRSASELFISTEEQTKPLLLLADAGVDRGLIANREPLTIVASASMSGEVGETVQLMRLSLAAPLIEVLGFSSTGADFGAIAGHGLDEFLVWRDLFAGSDSHPAGRARSAGDTAPLEVVVSPQFALSSVGMSLYLAEVRASTPSAVVVTLSSIDRNFNRTELASWPAADLVGARIRMGVLGKSFFVVLSNSRTQAFWLIKEGKVEPLRLQPPYATWRNQDLSCAASVCWLVATSQDATWVAAVTESSVGELVLDPGTEVLVTGTEASATVHRKSLEGSVTTHIVTCVD